MRRRERERVDVGAIEMRWDLAERVRRAGMERCSLAFARRICFRWSDHGPEDVEITDYH